MRSFEFFDVRAVWSDTDEVGGDETGGFVHLRQLVGQDVAVVVVRSHAKVPLGPLDQFHRRGVGEEMH